MAMVKKLRVKKVRKSRGEKLADAMVKEFVKRYPTLADLNAYSALAGIGDYSAVSMVLDEYEMVGDVNEKSIGEYLSFGKRVKELYGKTAQIERYAQRFCEICNGRMEVLNKKKDEFFTSGLKETDDYRFVLKNYLYIDSNVDGLPEGTFDSVRRAFDNYLSSKCGLKGVSTNELAGAKCEVYKGGEKVAGVVSNETYALKIIMASKPNARMNNVVVAMGFPVDEPIEGIQIIHALTLEKSKDGKLTKCEDANSMPPKFHVLNFAGIAFSEEENYFIDVPRFRVKDKRLLKHSPFIYHIYG